MKIIQLSAVLGAAALATSAHAQSMGSVVHDCVVTAQAENRLSEREAYRLQTGTLLRIYDVQHALGPGESITTLCTRIATIRVREQTQQATIETLQADVAVAQDRVQALERQIAALRGSLWKEHYGIGWLSAGIFLLLFSLMILRRIVQKHQEKTQRFRSVGSAHHLD